MTIICRISLFIDFNDVLFTAVSVDFHNKKGWLHYIAYINRFFRSSGSSSSCQYSRRSAAPLYLSRDLPRVSELVARRRLRSSSTSTLVVPPTRLSTAGDRAFPVAAARTWNNLPTSLTTLSSLASFRHQLKTELFVRSFTALDSSAYDRIWQILCSHIRVALAFCHCF